MSSTTTATLDAFRRDGFVVVPGLFDEAEMRRISEWTDELQALPERPGHCMMYFEPSLLKPGERVLQRIENFCPFHAGFAALCDGAKLLRLRVPPLRRARGAVQGQDQLQAARRRRVQAPPGPAGRLEHLRRPLHHRDGRASIPPPRRTAAWSSPPASTPAGSSATSGSRSPTRTCAAWTPGRCRPGPGDVVFFDSYTPHASGPNLTSERRRVLYITYNRRSAGDHRVRYYADKRKSFPPTSSATRAGPTRSGSEAGSGARRFAIYCFPVAIVLLRISMITRMPAFVRSPASRSCSRPACPSRLPPRPTSIRGPAACSSRP